LRRGRVEIALNREIRTVANIGPAEAEALRVVARALDESAAAHLVAEVNALSKTYLDLRLAAGLSVRTAARPGGDSFDAFLAELSSPDLGH
jgi:hypothetical protein